MNKREILISPMSPPSISASPKRRAETLHTGLSPSVILPSLATCPHKIQINEVRSYFNQCQGLFCNLIPWSQDFAQ